jgi:hypothetical protein
VVATAGRRAIIPIRPSWANNNTWTRPFSGYSLPELVSFKFYSRAIITCFS